MKIKTKDEQQKKKIREPRFTFLVELNEEDHAKLCALVLYAKTSKADVIRQSLRGAYSDSSRMIKHK